MKLHRLFTLFTAFLLTLSFTTPIQAAGDDDDDVMPCDDMTCLLSNTFEIKSKPDAYNTYGPSYLGTEGNSTELEVSETITTKNAYTGSLVVSKGSLQASVGFTFGTEFSVKARGTMNNPNQYWYKGYYREIRNTIEVIQDKQYVYGPCKGWANINKKVYPYRVTGAQVYWTR